ncbi:MAG: LysR substrate-binding domain-containing protein [Paracoccaceae bacterium]|nr:LysR substrate-binding domain-containing protein [Paracoccaceae bacterium]
MPNLKQLRAFEAAARLGSFKAAAEELHVTQAAISHQIKALEDDLDQELFHRRTRKVHPTAHARDFAARLTKAFQAISSATEELTQQQMEGEITVTMAPFYANRIILPRLAKFQELYPGLLVRPDMSSGVVDFRRDDIDAGVRYGMGDWPGLTCVLLHKDILSPVAAPELLKGWDLPIDPAIISGMTLGFDESTPGDWVRWLKAAGSDVTPHGTLIGYGNRARMMDMALSGLGVALADYRLTAADVERGNLVRLHPATIPSEKAMYIVYPATDHPDPRVIAFSDWLKDVLISLSPSD